MKLVYIEIEATAEDMKANPSFSDILRDELVRISERMETEDENEDESEED